MLIGIPFNAHAQESLLLDATHLSSVIKSVELDSTYSNGNWDSLLKQVENKRIVLLGELNHGSKEIFLSRNDLIQSLHEELGFNAILFESGIGEFILVDQRKETLTPTQMTYGFFGGWRTDEFVQLMEYVKSNDLSVSGFDVQRTGVLFESVLSAELEKLGSNAEVYSHLEERFSKEKVKLTDRTAVYDSVQNTTLKLIKDYQSLLTDVEEAPEYDSNEVSMLVAKTIENRVAYLKYFLDFVRDKDWNKRWEARDTMMYSNIDWLLSNIYKNQKVIVVAHNFHISRFNEKEEVMGEFLEKKYGSEMYSIGVFAGSGSYANNGGHEEELSPIASYGLDIREVINKMDCRVGFMDIPEQLSRESNWMHEDIIVNDTFIDLSGSNTMVFSKSFDGLLLIDSISPPRMILH